MSLPGRKRVTDKCGPGAENAQRLHAARLLARLRLRRNASVYRPTSYVPAGTSWLKAIGQGRSCP